MEPEDLVDLHTSDQIKTFVDAEAALGERLVARILIDTWSEENEDVWCWFNGCSECGEELHAEQEGYVWARPLGMNPESGHCALVTYCSEACVAAAAQEWGKGRKQDLIVAYYRL